MELFANDLSIHEQFHDIASFQGALEQLMTIRGTARRFARELHCHRAMLNCSPIQTMSMQQVIANIPVESQRRSAMAWLTRSGPFWDELRQHGGDDWLECREEIVTDTAVGEAAYRTMHGVESSLVSVRPSEWEFSPVEVTWFLSGEGLENQQISVDNWLDAAELEIRLQATAPPIRSWDELHDASTNRFLSLTFANDWIEPLRGIPFAKSSADRFMALLNVLELLTQAFDKSGKHTSEGHRLYQTYFTGDRAWFTDSSESEKHEFRNALTFQHPDDAGKSLFCTWHGKVSRLTLRLHYSWSGKAGDPVFVVYAGPKIPRR